MPYFFVDESGNWGFAFGRGSSPFFVLVFLWTADPEQLRERIQRLKSLRNLGERYELKYRKMSSNPELLHAVLQILTSLPVRVWVLAIDKRRLPVSFLKMDRLAFYEFAMGRLFETLPAEDVENSVLVLDDSTGTKQFTRAIRAHLSSVTKHVGRARSFRKVVGHDSHRDPAIQAADVIAGLVGDMLESGSRQEYALIEPKVVALIRFPPVGD